MKRILITVVLLLSSVTGCGYRLESGTARFKDPSVRMDVSPFANRSTTPDAGAVVAVRLREELALDEDEYQLALLAFTIDVDRQQWDSIFVAYARAATRSDLRARITRGIPDGWEYADSEFVPFEIDDLLSYLSRQDRRDRLTPVLPAAVILALKYEYGRTAVERAVRKRFG